ncbi:MAG: hypothetical protein WBO36_00135, partial [Saprospiraceae bacterium]
MSAFITSKFGKIDSLTIYIFKIEPRVCIHPESRYKLLNYLIKAHSDYIIDIKDDMITALDKLASVSNIKLIKTKIITIPFTNTQAISAYLAAILRTQYSLSYTRHRDLNTFEVSHTDIGLFRVLQCFSFNVEVFDDGRFLVHYNLVSKIVSSGEFDEPYFKKLKANRYGKDKNDINKEYFFTLYHLKTHRKKMFNFADQSS